MAKPSISSVSAIALSVLWAAQGAALAQARPEPAGDQDAKASVPVQMDMVMVTANRREQSVQDIPQSVAVITGDILEDTGIVNFNELLDKIPGLNAGSNGTTNNLFNIRGIGNVAGDFPTVGYYLDDTPISALGAPAADLFDLERIEVLRGPQSTLFGEGSIGGTIRVITAKPNPNDYEVKYLGSVQHTRKGGQAYRSALAVNIPLIEDHLAVRAVGSWFDDDGYIDNRATGTEDVNDQRSVSGRIAIGWEPNANLTITPAFWYQNVVLGSQSSNNPSIGDFQFANPAAGDFSLVNRAPNGGDLTLLDNAAIPNGTDLTLTAAFGERTVDEFFVPSVTVNYDLGFAELTSSTSYYDRNTRILEDDRDTTVALRDQVDLLQGALALPASFILGAPLPQIPLPGGTRSSALNSTETYTQEFRLVSDTGKRVDWLAGFFFRNRVDNSSVLQTAPDLDVATNPLVGAYRDIALFTLNNFVPPGSPEAALLGGAVANIENILPVIFDADSSVRYRQYAVYGEVNWRPIDRLVLTGGLRVFRELITSSAALLQTDASGIPLPADVVTTDDETIDVLFKAAARYELTSDAGVYFLFSQGTRPGGINERPLAPIPALGFGGTPVSFNQDFTNNYEVGLKSQFFDDRLLFNVALYWIGWDDVQLRQEPPIPSGGSFSFVANSGRARSRGVEVDTTLLLPAGFSVGGGMSFTDAVVTAGAGGVPTGSELPFSPRWKGTVFGAYDTQIAPGTMFRSRISYDYVGERFVGPSLFPSVAIRPPSLPRYQLVDAQFGVETPKGALTFFVDNIFDRRAVIGDVAFTPFEGVLIARPRSFGARLQLDF